MAKQVSLVAWTEWKKMMVFGMSDVALAPSGMNWIREPYVFDADFIG